MWQTITQQFLAGTFGQVLDPVAVKLYWRIMKQLQFPFAIAIEQDLLERSNDIPPEMKAFLLQNPNVLDMVARLMAQENVGAQQPSPSNSGEPKQKPGPNAQKASTNPCTRHEG